MLVGERFSFVHGCGDFHSSTCKPFGWGIIKNERHPRKLAAVAPDVLQCPPHVWLSEPLPCVPPFPGHARSPKKRGSANGVPIRRQGMQVYFQWPRTGQQLSLSQNLSSIVVVLTSTRFYLAVRSSTLSSALIVAP